MLVASLLLNVTAMLRAQEWTWKRELVDAAGGTFSALVVDDNGNVHIGYLSPEGGGTKYGFRPANGHWFTMVVDKNNGFVNLALDKEQRPHLCYLPYETLKYAEWDGAKWQIQEIAPGSGERNYSCGIAIGPDDSPHVTWYQLTSLTASYFVHIRHAVLKNGNWVENTLDHAWETGKWNCVRVDAQGAVHVSYSAFKDSSLRYARMDPDGKWSVATVEDGRTERDPTIAGMGNSMVLDKNGRPNFSYRDENTLRYAWPDRDHWRIQVVDSNANPAGNMSWINQRTSLALDTNGRPHIAYEVDGSLKHAWWDGSQWRIQPMGIIGPQHRYPSLAISKDNIIYIAYSDPEGGSLEVLVGRPKAEAEKAGLPAGQGEISSSEGPSESSNTSMSVSAGPHN